MIDTNKYVHIILELVNQGKTDSIKDILQIIYDKGYNNGRYDEFRQQLEDDYSI